MVKTIACKAVNTGSIPVSADISRTCPAIELSEAEKTPAKIANNSFCKSLFHGEILCSE